jgi:hypothetical protein
MANLNKYGLVADATPADTVVIAPVQIATTAGAKINVSDFSATYAGATATDTVMVDFQLSNDGIAFTTVDSILIQGVGMITKSLLSSLEGRIGQFFRVIANASDVGDVSATLTGTAIPQDIVDI